MVLWFYLEVKVELCLLAWQTDANQRAHWTFLKDVGGQAGGGGGRRTGGV